MSTKRMLVTGGCGFIGSHLAELCIEEGYDVIVFDMILAFMNTS